MTAEEKETCKQRQAECELDSYAFNKRLKLFGYTNWITVIVPSLLAVAAGSALFGTEAWMPFVGLAALVGGLLTAVHKGLNCEAYQTECRRLIRAYDGLATRYRTLHQVDRDDWLSDFLELEESLAALKEGATAKLPDGFREKMKIELDSKAI